MFLPCGSCHRFNYNVQSKTNIKKIELKMEKKERGRASFTIQNDWFADETFCVLVDMPFLFMIYSKQNKCKLRGNKP